VTEQLAAAQEKNMTLSQRTVEVTAEHLLASRTFAEAFLRYLNCSPAIQRVVVDLVKLVKDDGISEKEREHTLRALAVTLFTYDHDRLVGEVAAETKNKAATESDIVRTRLDQEEAVFADNLKRLLLERNLTQAELAEKAGLSQPAISMLLSRKYRPQRRTVRLIAQALNVAAADLWPGLPAEAPKPSTRGRRDHLANGAGPTDGLG
jgi:lambda repressor-like predicted transcriptional regulator